MKRLLFIIVILDAFVAHGQKSTGFFGKQNSIGVSVSTNLFNLSNYSKGRITIPTLQYTNVKNRMRSRVFEFGRFSMQYLAVDPNNGQNYNHYVFDGGNNYYPSAGSGSLSGTAYGMYIVRNWLSMGQLGSYHALGFHVTSLKYKSDDFQFQYLDDNYILRDTTIKGSEKPSMLNLGVSFGIGQKKPIGKSTRLIIDYGIRLRACPLNLFINQTNSIVRASMVEEGVRTFANSTLIMLYAGLHYAL